MIEGCAIWRENRGLWLTGNRCKECGNGPCHYNVKETDHMTDIPTPSLEASDDTSAKVQKTPNRITLESIKAKVAELQYIPVPGHPHMTLCMITMENGYILFGKSAPADPLNYNEDVGRQFAYEDALRQVWPLEAYVLRNEMFYLEEAEKAEAQDFRKQPQEE